MAGVVGEEVEEEDGVDGVVPTSSLRDLALKVQDLQIRKSKSVVYRLFSQILTHGRDSSDESGSEAEASEMEDEPHASDDEASEDEDDNEVEAKPYISLIKSLAESASEPKAKRRKLDSGAAVNVEPKQIEDSESDSNAEAKDTDLVEEPEEAPDETRIEDLFEEEDETPDSSDPFETHFANPTEDDFSKRVKAVQQGGWTSKKIATKTARNVVMVPKVDGESDTSLPASVSGPSDLKLKQRLHETTLKRRPKFDETEQSIASLMFGYRDVLFCKRTIANGNNLRRLACLHAVNHVFK